MSVVTLENLLIRGMSSRVWMKINYHLGIVKGIYSALIRKLQIIFCFLHVLHPAFTKMRGVKFT
jgi:hypothetical protein